MRKRASVGAVVIFFEGLCLCQAGEGEEATGECSRFRLRARAVVGGCKRAV